MEGKSREIRTFGRPALLEGGEEISLQNKHLALLVFLSIESEPHSAELLRDLLWSGLDSAPVALAKALGAVRTHAGEDALPRYAKSIWLRRKLPCDALALLEARRRKELRPRALRAYEAPFLAGFSLGADGPPVAEWNRWAGQQRERFERLFLELSAEEAKDLIDRRALDEAEEVLRYAGDRVARPWEEGETLAAEVRRGRERLRAERERLEALRLAAEHARAEQPRAEAAERAAGDTEERARDVPWPAGPAHVPAPKVRGRRFLPWMAVALAACLALLWIASSRSRDQSARFRQPRSGESITAPGEAAFLVLHRTLYQYPDEETLRACTGGHPSVVRRVASLPSWRRVMLPSVRRHPWMAGGVPIASDNRQDLTDYVVVGCVLGGVPDPQVFHRIFGHQNWDLLVRVPDSLIKEVLPQVLAGPYPLLPAGTLIRGSGDEIRWIVFQGGSLGVADRGVLKSHCRSEDEVVTVGDEEFGFYLEHAELQRAETDCGSAALAGGPGS